MLFIISVHHTHTHTNHIKHCESTQSPVTRSRDRIQTSEQQTSNQQQSHRVIDLVTRLAPINKPLIRTVWRQCQDDGTQCKKMVLVVHSNKVNHCLCPAFRMSLALFLGPSSDACAVVFPVFTVMFKMMYRIGSIYTHRSISHTQIHSKFKGRNYC